MFQTWEIISYLGVRFDLKLRLEVITVFEQ
jgi:hypothetical protein